MTRLTTHLIGYLVSFFGLLLIYSVDWKIGLGVNLILYGALIINENGKGTQKPDQPFGG